MNMTLNEQQLKDGVRGLQLILHFFRDQSFLVIEVLIVAQDFLDNFCVGITVMELRIVYKISGGFEGFKLFNK